MNIKFYKTYNIDKMIEIMSHKDIYKHIKIDDLEDKEELVKVMKDWLTTVSNYLIMDGVHCCGCVSINKIDPGVVDIHGGLFKEYYGDKSRHIYNELLKKLRRDRVQSVYMTVPESKVFVHKLAEDIGFNAANFMDTDAMIDGKKAKLIIYRKDI